MKRDKLVSTIRRCEAWRQGQRCTSDAAIARPFAEGDETTLVEFRVWICLCQGCADLVEKQMETDTRVGIVVAHEFTEITQ